MCLPIEITMQFVFLTSEKMKANEVSIWKHRTNTVLAAFVLKERKMIKQQGSYKK